MLAGAVDQWNRSILPKFARYVIGNDILNDRYFSFGITHQTEDICKIIDKVSKFWTLFEIRITISDRFNWQISISNALFMNNPNKN